MLMHMCSRQHLQGRVWLLCFSPITICARCSCWLQRCQSCLSPLQLCVYLLQLISVILSSSRALPGSFVHDTQSSLALTETAGLPAVQHTSAASHRGWLVSRSEGTACLGLGLCNTHIDMAVTDAQHSSTLQLLDNLPQVLIRLMQASA